MVQQKSNMVKPNEEIGGLPLNTDPAMEHDADDIAQNAEENMPFSADTDDVPLQAKAIDGVVQMANSQDSYNWTAGVASTIFTGLGMIGAVGSFLYSKNKDRKHRYIEEIEKYTDIAAEAYDDAEAAYDEARNSNDNNEKIKKYIETRKDANKAKRNAEIAIEKYENFGNKKDPNSGNAANRVRTILDDSDSLLHKLENEESIESESVEEDSEYELFELSEEEDSEY